jgi:hypothetical protein
MDIFELLCGAAGVGEALRDCGGHHPWGLES